MFNWLSFYKAKSITNPGYLSEYELEMTHDIFFPLRSLQIHQKDKLEVAVQILFSSL